MSKSNTHETEYLQLLYNNTAMAGVGDAGGLQPSAAPGSLYIGLHSGDPGEAGDQTTSEISYTGYARVAVARSGAGFTVSGNQVSNTAEVLFGQRTDVGTVTPTWFTIGVNPSGAGKYLHRGQINGGSGLTVTQNIIPRFQAGQLTVTED